MILWTLLGQLVEDLPVTPSHASNPSTPPFATTCLSGTAVFIPLVPVVDLTSDAFSIRFVLFAGFDKELWAMAGSPQVSLEVLPATVRFKGAVGVWASVGTKSLYLLAFDSTSGL